MIDGVRWRLSVVGAGITAGTIVLVCVFAVVIDRGGAGGLIAGYQAGELLPEREAELARDVRNLLLVSALSLVPLLVHFTVRELPSVVHTGVPSVVPLVGVGWLLWRWNGTVQGDADGVF